MTMPKDSRHHRKGLRGNRIENALKREICLFLDLAKGDELGPEEVAEKYGVPPEKVIDMLALAGLPSRPPDLY